MEKYEKFIQWAKACGHWQIVSLSENFEMFLLNVPADIQAKVLGEEGSDAP